MSTAKKYQCNRCGHVQQIVTNHFGQCYSSGHFNCCPNCPPWAKYSEFGGSTVWNCLEIEPESQETIKARQQHAEALHD